MSKLANPEKDPWGNFCNLCLRTGTPLRRYPACASSSHWRNCVSKERLREIEGEPDDKKRSLLIQSEYCCFYWGCEDVNSCLPLQTCAAPWWGESDKDWEKRNC